MSLTESLAGATNLMIHMERDVTPGAAGNAMINVAVNHSGGASAHGSPVAPVATMPRAGRESVLGCAVGELGYDHGRSPCKVGYNQEGPP